jgi:hypothetical protein
LKIISSASVHSSKSVATVTRCAFCCTLSRHGLNFADTPVVLKRSIIFAWHTSQENYLFLTDNFSLIWSHQITHFCSTKDVLTARNFLSHIYKRSHILQAAEQLKSCVWLTVFSRNAVLNP